MTKKELLEKAEKLNLPDGWKLKAKFEIVKYNRECPIDTTYIEFDNDSSKCRAVLTRSGNIYEDTLQDSIEALEILKQIIK